MHSTTSTHLVTDTPTSSPVASTAGGPIAIACGLTALLAAYTKLLSHHAVGWIGAALIIIGAMWSYLASTQLLRQRNRWRAASRSNTYYRDAIYRRNSATLRDTLTSIGAIDSHTRISMYLKDDNGFHLIGRYSNNPEYNRPGRHFIPDGQGYLWASWQHGIAGTCDAPTDPEVHAAHNVRRSNIPPEQAHNLRMRSRSLYGCRIDHPGATNQPFGVVVIESDLPRGVLPDAPAALTASTTLHELCADMTGHVTGAVPQHPDAHTSTT